MARHKRRSVGPLVRRSVYLSLWRQYQELLAAYTALQGDHQGVLEDREGFLYDREPPARHVPSWAVTEPIPVITSVGLDPDKASALTRNTGMTQAPGGAWTSPDRGTTG